MPAATRHSVSPSSALHRIPPLQQGDRLDRIEFERRYDAMPELKKAELLEGIVYMPAAAVSDSFHGGPHFNLIAWLGYYLAYTPGIAGGDNSSLRLDLDNEPQGDAYLRILQSHGGQARIDEDGYVASAPELIAEVSGSSVSYDLHVKLNVYRKHGVKEYVVWRVFDAAIDWFILRNGQYVRLPLVENIYRSEAFPGLWLEPDQLVRGEMASVFKTVQAGLSQKEHGDFVQQLAEFAVKAKSTPAGNGPKIV